MAIRTTPVVAVFTKNRTNPAYTAARLGADRAAARHGARVVHYVPQRPDNVEEQAALVEQAIGERPDAAVFVPIHVDAMDESVRKLNSARIPVVNFLNRLDRGEFVTFVGSDDYRIGRKIAVHLLGIGTSNALFRREEEYGWTGGLSKGASGRIGDWSARSSTRGARIRGVLASRASAGQRLLSARGVEPDGRGSRPGSTEAYTGAVTLIQRFGSAANLNIHLHCLVLDGVYRTTARTEATPLATEGHEPLMGAVGATQA